MLPATRCGEMPSMMESHARGEISREEYEERRKVLAA